MNMISTGSFLEEMNASKNKETVVSQLVSVWEKKNAKAAKAGGISLMALSLAACGSDSDDAAVVTPAGPTQAELDAANASIADLTSSLADATSTITELQTAASGSNAPSVGADNISGSDDADAVSFMIVQNDAGSQTNQLGTGDVVNLGSGTDTVNAVVQEASALGAGPTSAIMPYYTSVENAMFNAQDHAETTGGDNADGVSINAAQWYGTDKIGSMQSDADLMIYNVNTLNADDSYGDVGQATGTMTICMDHTGNGNMNGLDATEGESDLTVLFDEDYLIPGTATVSSGTAIYHLLDQDGVAQSANALGTTDLSHLVDANREISATGTERVFIERDGIAFNLGGTRVELRVDAGANGDYAGIETHAQYAASLQAAADAAGIAVTIAVDATDTERTQDSDGTNIDVPAIVVTSATQTISAPEFLNRDAGGYEFNLFGRFTSNSSTQTSTQVEVNACLLKVGRDGDGGDLVIGGMEDSGIDVFHVEVQGRADQPSSLASLSSTNNELEEVMVEAATGALASLEIGNSNTVGNVHEALLDVRVFDAASFDNGVTVHASIDATSIAKYQNLVDTANADENDDVAFTYSSGAGNDTMSVVIDGAVAASNSNIVSGRHDFSFSFDSGAGNDAVTVAITDDLGAANWYQNQQINNNVTINGGTGDDTIRTPGSGDANINAGTGNDAVYTDNDGDQGTAFNSGRATWLFNNENLDIDDTIGLDGVTAMNNIVNLEVHVTYAGYTVSAQIAGTSGTTIDDLSVNQGIKDAINGDEHMSHILVAEDHAGRSLVVRSLQDDADAAADLAIRLVNDSALTAGQTNKGFALISDAQAATLGFAAGTVEGGHWGTLETHQSAAADAATERFGSELATDGGVAMAGVNSTHTSDNVIDGGTGDDTIILGSNGDGVGADGDNLAMATVFATDADGQDSDASTTDDARSNDVVDYTAAWGNDAIVHFQADEDVTAREVSAGTDFIDFTAFVAGYDAGVAGGAGDFAVNTAVSNGATVVDADDSITIEGASATNDTGAEIIAFYTDDRVANTADNHIYIAVNADAVTGTVWHLTDGGNTTAGAAGADMTATSLGTIILIDGDNWTDMSADNFIVA